MVSKRSKSPDEKIWDTRAYFESLGEPDTPEYEFVHGIGDATSRSHAMKSYWKHKKSEKRRQEDTRHIKPALRTLLPSEVQREDQPAGPSQPQQFQPTEDTSLHPHNSSVSVSNARAPGIAQQLFSGFNFALSSALGQDVEFSSFQILAHHHRYFYHWLRSQSISPFRDIWIPIDLSNAASFNGILAHAAADLNGRREDEDKSEILKFKTEAIGTINLWLKSSTGAIKDKVVAGVVRLLTFERYWGTRDRFNMHKYGLRQIIDTMGGYQAFHTNWRLQLVVSLLNIVEIEETEAPPLVAYLLQEYESFVFELLGLCYVPYQSSKRYQNLKQLQHAASLKETIQTLQIRRRADKNKYRNALSDRAVIKHLKSLLFIWASVQESEKSSHEALGQKESICLTSLDTFLHQSRQIWASSLNDTLSTIWESFVHMEEHKNLTQFVTIVAGSLVKLSPKALWGVEECLLRYWDQNDCT
ncbi:hypothetical protein VI817_002013 [Penicillium citrinum]|nr:hypothetical protein VI817_002013 [Penicillium citrinum]